MGLTILAGMAAAAAQAAQPAPATPAAPSSSDTVQTIVVEAGKAPVIGDMQKGTLIFNPTFFTQVRPATAMDMVQWLPGFTFTDTRDVRGLEGSGGNVLIDGKPPTSKTDTLFSVLRRIPSEQVERVDIIVGGAPGIDMHGWAVIANVILKKSATRRGFVGASLTTDTHGRTNPELLITNSRNEDGRSLDYTLDIGQAFAVYPGYGYGPWVRYDGTGAVLLTSDTHVAVGGPIVTANGAYGHPLAGGALKVNGLVRYYGTNIDETDTLTSQPGTYLVNHTQTYLQGELGASYERALGPRFTLNTQVLERPTHYKADNLVTRPPTSQLNKVDDENESVLRATLRFKKDDKLTLESSAEGALNSAFSKSDVVLNGQAAAAPDTHTDIHERRAEVGETLSWKPGPKTSLDAALKLETSTFEGQTDSRIENTFTYLKPRLVFTWSPNKDFQVRGRVEREVGQINFGYFAANLNLASGALLAGNADVRPSSSWTDELTLERRFWTGGDLSLTLRRMDVSDVLDFIPATIPGGAVVNQSANIGGGWENDAILNLTLPLKSLGLNGMIVKSTLTWSSSAVTDPVSGLQRRLSGKSSVTGEFHLAYDLPQWKLNVGLDAWYQSPSKTWYPLGNQRMGDWGRINLFAEYRAKPNLNLRAELDDLPGSRTTVVNDTYAGVRGQSPLLYSDVKNLAVGPLLFLRARRTFN